MAVALTTELRGFDDFGGGARGFGHRHVGDFGGGFAHNVGGGHRHGFGGGQTFAEASTGVRGGYGGGAGIHARLLTF